VGTFAVPKISILFAPMKQWIRIVWKQHLLVTYGAVAFRFPEGRRRVVGNLLIDQKIRPLVDPLYQTRSFIEVSWWRSWKSAGSGNRNDISIFDVVRQLREPKLATASCKLSTRAKEPPAHLVSAKPVYYKLEDAIRMEYRFSQPIRSPYSEQSKS
jgi:hypothetical protein